MNRVLMLAVVVLAGCGQQQTRQRGDGQAQADVPADDLAQKAENVFGIRPDSNSALAVCFTREEERTSPDDMTLEQRQEKIGCINQQVVPQIRPVLPKRIDQMTTMVNIDASGPVLNYYYKIDATAASLPADVKQTIEQEVRQNVCGTPQMSQTISLGGIYAYHYADRAGQPVHDVRIDHC